MQRDRFTQASSSNSGNKMQIIQKPCPDRALPKSKTVSQSQGEDESNISHMHRFQQISVPRQVELSIPAGSFTTVTQETSKSQGLIDIFPPPENKSLIHHKWIIKGVFLGKAVEPRGEDCKHGGNPRLPMIFHVKRDPWFLRRLERPQISRELWFYILSELGKRRRNPVNPFKVCLCFKKKPIPYIILLDPKDKREIGRQVTRDSTEYSKTSLGVSMHGVSFMLMAQRQVAWWTPGKADTEHNHEPFPYGVSVI